MNTKQSFRASFAPLRPVKNERKMMSAEYNVDERKITLFLKVKLNPISSREAFENHSRTLTPIFVFILISYEFANQKTPEEECIALEMGDDMEKCLTLLKSITQSANSCDGDKSSSEMFPPFG